MKILVVGGGGREHALAWKLAQSGRAEHIYVAPGNAGTALDARMENVPISDINELARFAQREGVGLTVVGPEVPLAAGIVDVFRRKGLRIFGPTRAAAQLESSKDFAKAFMQRHGIPTADYQTFNDAKLAHAYVAQQGVPIVIKADGLAAGKGVVVATTLAEAHDAIDTMLLDNRLGASGARVVIEDFLEGEEASFIVMVDGQHVLALATSQDHKRLLDGDHGPNTGGMGAYSPAPVITPEVYSRVMDQIIKPTVIGMATEGTPFTGFLYAGLMIDAHGHPKTLEFNCRMGDPETQPIMARMKSDLVPIFEAAVEGRLDSVDIEWDQRTALGVVLAAENYPGTPRTGDVIHGLPNETVDSIVFHAGTALKNQQVLTQGGRVLCAVGLGEGIKQAQKTAYNTVEKIHFDGIQYRRDIGWRSVLKDSSDTVSTEK